MNIEQFKEIEDLRKEIETSNYLIKDLDTLKESDQLSCVISCEGHGKRGIVKYYVKDIVTVSALLSDALSKALERRSDLLIKFDAITVTKI